MTTIASIQDGEGLFPLFSIIPFCLFIHSSLRWSWVLAAAPTEQDMPSLLPRGSLATTTSEQSWGPRGSTSALLALEFQLSRIHNDLPSHRALAPAPKSLNTPQPPANLVQQMSIFKET